jgi:hypothetical protein
MDGDEHRSHHTTFTKPLKKDRSPKQATINNKNGSQTALWIASFGNGCFMYVDKNQKEINSIFES